jgi:hypothetical protein
MTRPRSKYRITLAEYRNNMAIYRVDNPASSKLTAEAVRYIRASTAGHSMLARLYSVSEGTIRAVRDFTTWRHVR